MQETILPLSNVNEQILGLKQRLCQQILGQEALVERLLVALLADGHLLVEGAPGLAKTKAVKALASAVEGSFQRIQFTPDLLPSDITGSDIYRPQEESFHFQAGPLFSNMILADEINRAPAKVQSALLEAMAEHQITVGQQTHRLPPLFFVMATQNPIEQEGTYPLPEAQLDRFLMYVRITYPQANTERQILQLARQEAKSAVSQRQPFPPLSQQVILQARQQVMQVHMSEAVEQYLISLVLATREPHRYSERLGNLIQFGVSPRATIALDRCSRAYAWLQQREFVTPQDVHAVLYDVLRHRIVLGYEAQAQEITTDQIIGELLDWVAVP